MEITGNEDNDSPRSFEYIREAIEWSLKFLDLHMHKLVSLTIAFICSRSRVCAAKWLLLVTMTMFMVFRRLYRLLSTASVLLCVTMILIRVAYQIPTAADFLSTSLKLEQANLSNTTISMASWLGLEPTDHLFVDIQDYLLISGVIFLDWILPRLQRHKNQGIKHLQAVKSVTSCFKFLVNYAMYKFGMELCCVVTVVCMAFRLDAYACLYGFLLFLPLYYHRRIVASIWRLYCLILAAVMCIQYALLLGLPPNMHQDYLMSQSNVLLTLYLGIPSSSAVKHQLELNAAQNMLADYFQLLFACQQLLAFHVEFDHNLTTEMDRLAGKNPSCVASICCARNIRSRHSSSGFALDTEAQFFLSSTEPLHDFISVKLSHMDYVKHFVFMNFYWITLAFVFVAGVNYISLLYVGNMFISMYLLSGGYHWLCKPPGELLLRWNVIITFSYVVFLIKTCLQVYGCVWLSELTRNYVGCVGVKLFAVQCMWSRSLYDKLATTVAHHQSCDLPHYGNARPHVVWEVLCFALLLLQRRIFLSNAFQRVVTTELYAQRKMAARGAKHFNMALRSEVELRREKEQSMIEQIRLRVNRLRARCAQVSRCSVLNPIVHDCKYHWDVIYGADPRMFDDDADLDARTHCLSTPAQRCENATLSIRSPLPPEVAAARVVPDIYLVPSHSAERECESQSPPALLDESTAKPNPLQIVSATFYGGLQLGLRVAIANRKQYQSCQVLSNMEGNATDYCDMLDTEHTTRSTVFSLNTAHSATLMLPNDLPVGARNRLQVPKACAEVEVKSQHETCPSRQKNRTTFILDAALPYPNELLQETGKLSHGAGAWRRIKHSFVLSWHVSLACVDWLTLLLEKHSRSYNAAALKVEREICEVKRFWMAAPGTPSHQPRHENGQHRFEIEATANDLSHPRDTDEVRRAQDEMRIFQQSHARPVKLMVFCTNFLIAHCDKLCFFMLILNHMLSANILSLPYAVSVFLYGMLSLPRPTQNYWRATIYYTIFVIGVKYVCQFPFDTLVVTLNANNVPDLSEEPLWWPRLVGVEQKTGYALLDLIQLVFLSIQKAVLQGNGLWRDEADYELQTLHLNGSGSLLKKQIAEEQQEANKINKTESVSSQNRFLNFFHQLRSIEFRWYGDVYVGMFMCEFLSLLVITFGYRSFAPGGGASGDITTFIQTSSLPIPFTLMLLCQFLVVIVDRCIFLYRNVTAKFMLHVAMVITVHVWIFVAVPAMTHLPFNQNVVAIIFYVFKCFYFALSAYQIHAGYPRRVLRNFLAQKYTLCNKIGYKLYMLIPFLFEFRILLDWICVPTSLSFYNWLCIEDARYAAFCQKVNIVRERYAPQKRGERVTACQRIGMLFFFLALCLLVWVPVFVFSFSTSVFQVNPPVQFDFQISMNGQMRLSEYTAEAHKIASLSEDQYEALRCCYQGMRDALGTLGTYQPSDIHLIHLPDAYSPWEQVSSYLIHRLLAQLRNVDQSFYLSISYSFWRKLPLSSSISKASSGAYSPYLKRTWLRHLNQTERLLLAELVEYGSYDPVFTDSSDNSTEQRMKCSSLPLPQLPTYIQLSASSSEPLIPATLLTPSEIDGTLQLNLCVLRLVSSDVSTFQLSWRAEAVYSVSTKTSTPFIVCPAAHKFSVSSAVDKRCSATPNVNRTKSSPKFLIFADRTAPTIIWTLTGGSTLIGLYASVVIIVWRVIRASMVSEISHTIQFYELPNVDRILNLCEDISTVRECGELNLEEELFACFLYLYRSPETRIKWTRPTTSLDGQNLRRSPSLDLHPLANHQLHRSSY